MRRMFFTDTAVSRLGAAAAVLLVAGLMPVSVTAQPPEAEAVMDGMVDPQIIEIAEYGFLAVAYDVDDNVMYVAAVDGEHYDPAMEVLYKVPVAAINDVNVVSNSDVAIRDGKRIELESGFDDSASGDFQRASMGCTVKLVAKDYDFGFAGLAEGVVSDGQFTVAYEELMVEPAKEAEIGFFMCDHARNMQRELEKLLKQVKKGE